MNVTLEPISADTVRAVTRLRVADDQRCFVAENAVSLAQALFAPEAWYRAIAADGELAGFVMLYDETLRPDPPPQPVAMVWRFMVDARFQRRGIGVAALKLVIEHVRSKGAFRALTLSYVPEPGNAEPVYSALGFHATGRIDDGEVEMELLL